jgi:putative transposase
LLTQALFSRLQPLLPNKPRGVPRLDDRRVIGTMIHVIRNGLMWRDAPAADGLHKTLYNRFVPWRRVGVFDRIFATLATERAATNTVMMEPNPPPNAPHRGELA